MTKICHSKIEFICTFVDEKNKKNDIRFYNIINISSSRIDAKIQMTTEIPKNVSELVQQVYETYEVTGETYANCLIKVLRKHHLWPAMQVKKLKDNDNLVLLHNTYQRDDVGHFKELYDQCRSIVLDFSQRGQNVVVSYSNNIPERINIDEFAKISGEYDSFQEAYDGTMITVYYFQDKWQFGTSCCTDAYLSKFSNTGKSHGHLFDEVLLTYYLSNFSQEEINSTDPEVILSISNRLREMFTSQLDPSFAYEFVLVHHENPHIVDYLQQLGVGYRVIYHIASKNRETLELVDINSSKPLQHIGVIYPNVFPNMTTAYNHMMSVNSYGFIVRKCNTPTGVKLYKISPPQVEFKEDTDPCNPNVWHNILLVYMKNRKDYKINDYIQMYATGLQLPVDNRGTPIDPTYLIHTMISTLRDVLYNLYVATTTYNTKTKRFRMNKDLDKQFPPVIRFHLAQLRHRQLNDHSNAFIRPKDVYYYLCHCNNVKNIKLLITLFATTVGYNITERSALCLTVLNGLL